MENSLCLMARTFIATLLVLCPEKLPAAEAPKSPERLRGEASHIVTGELTRTEIRSRYSEIEAGSFDYAILCSIAVESVEKGVGIKPGEQLVASCFRPKTRLGFLQQISLQGHWPVPAPGQQVRAYLVRGRGTYSVVHPNGFATTDTGRLIAANEIAQLGRGSPVFTFLLPLELWVLIAVVVVPAAVVVAVVPRPRLRKVLKLVLAVPAALLAAGLFVGVLEFGAATDPRSSWLFRVAVILLGISVVVACGALTVWLGAATVRQPTANARREALSLGSSASTGAAGQKTAADGDRDPGI
jgi:hypothetical protein